MAKELEKFDATYKKMQPALARCTKVNAQRVGKAARTAWLVADGDGIRHFAESLARARSEGVTGDKLADFVKNRHVAEALKVYETAVKEMVTLQQELATLTKDAEDTKKQAATLLAEMDKDLKARPTRSESRAAIETLRETVSKSVTELDAAIAVRAAKNKVELEYASKSQQKIAATMTAAPAAQQALADDTLLPQALVDRNRKRSRARAGAIAKEISDAADAAIAVAAEDTATAVRDLKALNTRFDELKKVRADYTKAVAYVDQRNALKGTKDEAAVRQVMTDIDKFYELAERKLRGAITTVRKAS